ncbi:MAG: hypothetical protein QOJ19_542, partial [Acidimicrobiia bacterium]|nr:hypothetical protein [Acidimicrobiia bacterium]
MWYQRRQHYAGIPAGHTAFKTECFAVLLLIDGKTPALAELKATVAASSDECRELSSDALGVNNSRRNRGPQLNQLIRPNQPQVCPSIRLAKTLPPEDADATEVRNTPMEIESETGPDDSNPPATAIVVEPVGLGNDRLRGVATGIFLFTDIEGSTRLWAEHPDAMRHALEAHDEILGRTVGSAGGSVFKHTGDGVCACFPSARAAISAAAAAQLELTGARWGEVGALRARMAIHAGEAVERDGDWFGPGLNRAARLMGVAHGGQVVLSAAALDLARDGFPSGLEVADLGVHRLRDLADPEHVFQLAGAGLAAEFPPLRSLDAYRGNLPEQLTSFVGRDDELSALAAAINEHRLLTLVGPGGTGKTRMALHTAAAVVDRFPDGVWIFELASIDDPGALEQFMAATMHLVARQAASPRALLVEAIRGWRALLVLDNCEHLQRACALIAAELLAASRTLCVLATSREPLRSPGEQVWAIGALTAASSAQLFVERALASNRHFNSDTEGDAVTAICAHLDGLPLAIELAAARTRAMTATEILARLDQRFRLLTSPQKVRGGRHASLQQAVDWSYDLLDPAERRLFARLSVFAGGFDLEAAHAVCGADSADDLSTLQVIDALVDKSLVTASQSVGRTRYSLLEIMRQYGAERLDAGQNAELLCRHAQYFTALAERSFDEIRGPNDVSWVARIDDELDNLRVANSDTFDNNDTTLALRLSASLCAFNMVRGHLELWLWAERALTLPNAASSPLSARVHAHVAHGRYRIGDLDTAVDHAQQARETEHRLGLIHEPLTDLVMAFALIQQGRHDETARYAIAAAERAAGLGQRFDHDRAEALFILGLLRLALGVDDAPLNEELDQFSQRLGNAHARAGALGVLGLAAAADDYQRSVDLLQQSAAQARRVNDSFRLGWALSHLRRVIADHDPETILPSLLDTLMYYRHT